MSGRIGMAVELAGKDGKSIGPGLPPRPEHQQVIGVVCTGMAAKLRASESDILRMVGKLIDKYPDAIFVCMEKRSDRMAAELLEFWGVEPVILPTNEHHRRVAVVKQAGEWNGKQYEPGDKVTLYDNRKMWRDSELIRGCDKVMVFAPRGGSSDWRTYVEKDDAQREKYPSWFPKKVYLVEYGEAPPPKPKVRRAKKRAKAFA